MSRKGVIGVSDHGGWAVFVAANAEGKMLDRRRVELVADGLPKIPHHSEGKLLPLSEAVALVERVQASAEQHARLALDAVAAALPGYHLEIALRACPELPPSIAERITDYHASNNADWVMYRQVLAAAAGERGWRVHWFDSRKVFRLASEALGVASLDGHFAELRRSFGPPWGQDHKLALAAAVAVSSGPVNPGAPAPT